MPRRFLDAAEYSRLEHIRIPLVRSVLVAWEGREEKLAMLDIGLRGISVEHAFPPVVGTSARVRFTLPGNDIAIDARCRVAWQRHKRAATARKALPPGCGLEFVDVDAAAGERILRHVRRHMGKTGRSRRFVAAWPESQTVPENSHGSEAANRPRVDVVLVRPENPANIGAVARAMRNTGLGQLVLVAPSPFRTVECWRSAWGAHDVLEAIEEAPDLPWVLDRYEHLAAFAGRTSADQPATDVRDVAAAFAALPPSAKAAFVFGPETAGLGEDELRRCGVRVQIPTHPDQPSINLSHAVLVAGYEWLRAAEAPVSGGEGLASRAEREAFLERWRPAVIAAGALAEDDTRYFGRWEDFFRRAPLSSRDLRLFSHLARKLGRP